LKKPLKAFALPKKNSLIICQENMIDMLFKNKPGSLTNNHCLSEDTEANPKS